MGLERNELEGPESGHAGMAAEQLGSADELRSPIVWLVLALVIEVPSHGYEINQRYEARFGGFLPVSGSSVYAALGRLQSAGMIEPIALEASEGSPRQRSFRRSYRATAAGARAYRVWVASRMRDDPQRVRLLGRLASTGLLGIGALIELVDRYEQECLREAKTMSTSDGRETRRADRGMAELAEHLVAEQQRLEMRAQLDWVAYARKEIRAHARRRVAKEQAAGS
jgi:DNA-binding PadR family transcriptional regulator